jgi:hypothetical protein
MQISLQLIFEQCLDLFQVPTLGRVMNLAAEGKAAPSERDQCDGSAAETWGMAMSAKKRAHIV